LSTYSFVFASRRLSHSNPASGFPVSRIERRICAAKMARIEPLATGSRITMRPFHFGSSTSSQSCGACAESIACVL